MKKLEKTAGGVVFSSDFKEIYLIYKKERDEWLLPKGHISEGESVINAAKREVLEETGLKNIMVIGLSPCANNVFELPGGNTKSIAIFVMMAQDKTNQATKQQENEGLSGQWFSVEEAIKHAEYDDIKQAIKNAYEKTKHFRSSG